MGEPINPEAWRWYHEVVGDSRCPIVDTWWQTETAGHMIAPLPRVWEEKPGSATLPFFGEQSHGVLRLLTVHCDCVRWGRGGPAPPPCPPSVSMGVERRGIACCQAGFCPTFLEPTFLEPRRLHELARYARLKHGTHQ